MKKGTWYGIASCCCSGRSIEIRMGFVILAVEMVVVMLWYQEWESWRGGLEAFWDCTHVTTASVRRPSHHYFYTTPTLASTHHQVLKTRSDDSEICSSSLLSKQKFEGHKVKQTRAKRVTSLIFLCHTVFYTIIHKVDIQKKWATVIFSKRDILLVQRLRRQWRQWRCATATTTKKAPFIYCDVDVN